MLRRLVVGLTFALVALPGVVAAQPPSPPYEDGGIANHDYYDPCGVANDAIDFAQDDFWTLNGAPLTKGSDFVYSYDGTTWNDVPEDAFLSVAEQQALQAAHPGTSPAGTHLNWRMQMGYMTIDPTATWIYIRPKDPDATNALVYKKVAIGTEFATPWNLECDYTRDVTDALVVTDAPGVANDVFAIPPVVAPPYTSDWRDLGYFIEDRQGTIQPLAFGTTFRPSDYGYTDADVNPLTGELTLRITLRQIAPGYPNQSPVDVAGAVHWTFVVRPTDGTSTTTVTGMETAPGGCVDPQAPEAVTLALSEATDVARVTIDTPDGRRIDPSLYRFTSVDGRVVVTMADGATMPAEWLAGTWSVSTAAQVTVALDAVTCRAPAVTPTDPSPEPTPTPTDPAAEPTPTQTATSQPPAAAPAAPAAPPAPPTIASPAAPTTRLRLRVTPNRTAVPGTALVRLRATVTNTGRATARGVRVCQPMAPSMSLHRLFGGRLARGQSCWTIAALAPGASRTVTMVVRTATVGRVTRTRPRATATASNATAVTATTGVRILPTPTVRRVAVTG